MHPLDLFYESTELQRMAGDRNVRVVLADDCSDRDSDG